MLKTHRCYLDYRLKLLKGSSEDFYYLSPAYLCFLSPGENKKIIREFRLDSKMEILIKKKKKKSPGTEDVDPNTQRKSSVRMHSKR